MARVLLLLPTATYRAPDFLKAAASLGVEVVVGSEHRQAMATSMGDRAILVPLKDPAAAVGAIEELHRRSPLDAVVAVDDQGVLVAALASQSLGLVSNSPAAVAATRDKASMRARFAAAGVRQPSWQSVEVGDDAGVAAAGVGFPCVVKPVSLSASRGVIRADNQAAATAAANRVRSILAAAGEPADQPILIEQFVPGAEVAVEGILSGGQLTVLALFDKPDPLDGPYFEETLYVTPSRQPAAVQAAIAARTAQAVGALGLTEGPIHAELRLARGDATILEVAARTIGGLCARSLRFGLDVSLEELVLRHALGLDTDGLQREDIAAGVMMLPIPAGGILESVGGQVSARAVPGIVGLEISIPLGRPVQPLPEGDRYLGFAFARATTPVEVETALRAAQAALEIKIRPGPV